MKAVNEGRLLTHQQLIVLSKDAVILRLRTRDVGDTVFDSEISCQLHWDKYWIPYIVLNTDERIRRISTHEDVKRIVLSRHYEVLGGITIASCRKNCTFEEPAPRKRQSSFKRDRSMVLQTCLSWIDLIGLVIISWTMSSEEFSLF
ncbi:MAG: hypothetical protein A4E72_01657 [Syntrophus sp. PtaU1.Bin208]|nr:MAG: hypothetical protein A4E72_01657 [Syntrophus sp. PtaU1.Bin208]